MIDRTTQLNRPGATLSGLSGVHAITDVTGFGLLGHTLEVARASGLTAKLRYTDLPWLAGVRELAAQGAVTGTSGRNWASYGESIALAPHLAATMRALLRQEAHTSELQSLMRISYAVFCFKSHNSPTIQ